MTASPFTPADTISLGLFILFSLVMILMPILMVLRTHSKPIPFLIVFAAYLSAFCAMVGSGRLSEHPFPLVPLLFLWVILMSGWFAFSSYGRAIGLQLPLVTLIGFQAFRFPLELLLHHWSNLGTVPSTMTWPQPNGAGQNLDILSGLLALLALPILWGKRSYAIPTAWITQIVGILLLVNVLRVVILSSPLPFAWALENPMRLILYLPYALIAPLFVGGALAIHLVTIRKLLNKP